MNLVLLTLTFYHKNGLNKYQSDYLLRKIVKIASKAAAIGRLFMIGLLSLLKFINTENYS